MVAVDFATFDFDGTTMPLTGGPSDKAGNSYERRWTVLVLLDLLDGDAQSLRIEVPGEAGAGAEFRVTASGIDKWHQVKRQRDGGPWTIQNMRTEGVLGPWWPKFASDGNCVFVSSTGAQELNELVERAWQAASWDEFSEVFLVGNQVSRFQRLQGAWSDARGEEVYEALQRVKVHLIGEADLARWVNDRLAALVTGDPSTAAAVLAQLVDESLHRELTAADVWERLATHGISPRNLGDDAALVERLAYVTESYQRRIRRLYVGGREIPRPVADEAFARLADHSQMLIAGSAGAGKSVIVNRVLTEARRAGWTTLVVAADRLPLASTTAALGAALGLPDSPTTVLASVASGSEALLVIDQLDAVSVVSGRRPDRLGLVEDLIGEAAAHRRLRVVVACRQFDLDNDRELAAVAADGNTAIVRVGDLDEQLVRQALREASLPERIPDRLLHLLRVPQHLALYVELADAGVPDVSEVRSLTQLYERYWQVKRTACTRARDGQDDWVEVIDRLVDHMSLRQELAAPAALVDHLHEQVIVMASESVLVAEGGRISFFHETFFDYCFARRLVASGGSLRNLLTTDEQDLFRRAQVRQLLAYERDTDPTAYMADFKWLLTSSGVRLHIKALVVALTQTSSSASADEWAVLRPIANDAADPLHHRVWLALRQNSEWFPVLADAGDWSAWLGSSDPTVVDQATWALSGVTGAHPADAAALVGTLPRDDRWPARLIGFLRASGVHGGRPLFDLFLGALDDGHYDQRGSEFWWAIRDLAAHGPEWAVEALTSLLRRAVELADAQRVKNPFEVEGPLKAWGQPEAGKTIIRAAEGAPGVFVEMLLPLMLEIAGSNARSTASHDGARLDAVWSMRIYLNPIRFQDHLHLGMERALQAVATAAPEQAAAEFGQLRNSSLETAWFLLARGYAGNPDRFADEATDWLIDSPGALDLGFTDATHWVSRELVAAISPMSSDERFGALVSRLIGYAPPDERTRDGFRRRGYAELGLLNALDPPRRFERVERRLAELRRKFNQDDIQPPRGTWDATASPPIPEERARRMTNKQWIGGMTRHRVFETRFAPTGQLMGDAHTQAPVLEAVVKDEPDRFARLFLRLPADIPEPYVHAILRGLAGTRLDPELLLGVCQRAHQIGGSEVNRWVVRLIESEAAAALPNDLLDIVINVVAGDPDPQPNTPHDDGLNTTRGAAALTLAALIREDTDRLPHVADALRHVALDPESSVRDLAAVALTTTIYADAPLALELFHSSLDRAPEDLLASSNVEGFVHHAIRRGRYTDVAPVLDRMRNAHSAEAQRAGSRQLAVASIVDPDLDPLVDSALAAHEASRVGVVEVFADNVTYEPRRDRILQVLIGAFADTSHSVRTTAARAFYRIDGQRLDPYEPLITAITDSPSLQDGLGGILAVIEQSRHPLPPAVLDLCERFVGAHGHALGDITTAAAGDGIYVVRLAIRLHAQHDDPGMRERCLDLIDQLIAAQAHSIDTDLAALER